MAMDDFTRDALQRASDDVARSIEYISMKAIETEEDFMFRTVSPFCTTITKYRISKQDLVTALSRQKAMEPFKSLEGNYACRNCLVKIVNGNNYCPVCGQKVKWKSD